MEAEQEPEEERCVSGGAIFPKAPIPPSSFFCFTLGVVARFS
jgi:hypothetical protein